MIPRLCRAALLCFLAAAPAGAQLSAGLISKGHITVGDRSLAYEIRHLPLSSFPEVPAAIAAQLASRDCLVPQTYEARRPENVVHGSFEGPLSSDWAVLCSSQGVVSLLVFFGSAPDRPMTLATLAETQRLQGHYNTPVLGFNWGIDPASPQRVHEAQVGLSPRQARPDHDALADSVLDRSILFHFYSHGSWSLLDMPE